MKYSFFLAGNANVGKTSLFNNLTRSYEHVGNWHGVTVEAKSKPIKYNDNEITVTDLPGIYSLTVYSSEENVSRDRIIKAALSGGGSLIINVAEVNNLPRNLYLTVQLLELGAPFILAINMVDELKKNKTIDYGVIEKYIGAPVVAVSAKHRGDTKKIINAALDYYKRNPARIRLPYLSKLPLGSVKSIVKDFHGLPADWCALKLLERDSHIAEVLRLSVLQLDKINSLGDYADLIAEYRYEYIESITGRAVSYKINGQSGGQKSKERIHGESAIDKIILNKYLALPVFLLFMCLIFLVTFGSIGSVPMPGKFLSTCLARLMDLMCNPLVALLEKRRAYPWITALVRDAIIGGVGGVLVFLPQVVILFLFLAFMEDTGYMSRVAFMTDGLFRKIGLSGKSSFTLLTGFGCSASAVLTSRNLEEENVRIKTVMITPFMSCGARLPVYAVIGGAFFGGGNVLLIFALYLIGVLAAVFWAWIFERFTKLKSKAPDYIMEMPPYRMPAAIRIAQILLSNVKVFLIRVGTLIFSLNVIIWIVSNFTFGFVYVGDGGGISMMKMIAGFIAPVFRPLGFGDWKAVTALISGLIAKESVVSVLESMGAITGEGAIFSTALSAVSFLLFTLLYIPCVAAISAVNKEIGKKYMLLTLLLEFVTAYTVSFLVYNIGMLFV